MSFSFLQNFENFDTIKPDSHVRSIFCSLTITRFNSLGGNAISSNEPRKDKYPESTTPRWNRAFLVRQGWGTGMSYYGPRDTPGAEVI